MSPSSTTEPAWGNREEQERRRRILVAVAAYAYECRDEPIMSDHEYDHWAELVDPSISTGHPVLDEFFRTEFSPMTGMWIRDHPEIDKIEQTWERYYKNVVLHLRRTR